jgi:hypothetical protein
LEDLRGSIGTPKELRAASTRTLTRDTPTAEIFPVHARKIEITTAAIARRYAIR